jgi:hypothetical protein
MKVLNPNTHTCPVFRTVADAEVAKKLHARAPALANESLRSQGNSWQAVPTAMFHMGGASKNFLDHDQLQKLGGTFDELIGVTPMAIVGFGSTSKT